MNTVVCVATAAFAMGLLSGAPASATECTYAYNPDGYPQWSDSCETVLSPGHVGPLTMGKTTVARARSLNYLAKNPACGGRVDAVGAGPDWRRKDGKVVAWQGRVTTKGLRTEDSFTAAKANYPGLERTSFLANPYLPGKGWRIYSTRGKAGWLDVYVDNVNKTISWFAVRAKSIKKPIKSWSLDGC